MRHAFTIDYEDWYQGLGIPITEWHQFEKRMKIGHDHLLELLDKHNVKATFFMLGKTIEDHPSLFREIIDAGHEIGSHSYSHSLLFNLTPQQFADEMNKCKQLADEFGVQYSGFRAPYFSVTNESLWVLDELKRLGYKYDSSIYPGDNKRTGIKNYRKDIHQLNNGMWEFPISTYKIYKYEFGVGGAYFRILPYTYFKKRLKETTKEHPAVFYIHPWELDVHHPVLNVRKRDKIPHYINLSKTKRRLDMLFRDFEFTTMSNVLEDFKQV